MTYLFDDKIRYDDSMNLQAFGRLRVANARILGDYRFMYGVGTEFELNYVTSNSASITINYTSVCAVLTTNTVSGSSAIMQTKQYHPYIPGTGNFGMMTFIMTTSVTGLIQCAGMFDDQNGIFFRMRNGTAEFVIRNRGVDSEVVAQSAWNVDRLDGSMTEFNQSGITANWATAQILGIDFQWLGVGRVRCGFVINGEFLECHHFEHANIINDGTYMAQPSNPLRWEIKNTTSMATSHTMTSICGSVQAEGGDIETGFIRAVSTDGNSVSVTSSNSVYGKGILAIRLKNNFNNKPVRALARLKGISMLADADLNFKIAILHGSSTLTAATWTSVPGLALTEYSTNFTLNSSWATSAMVIDDQFVTGATNNKLGAAQTETTENRNSVIFQNYNATDSQIMAIIGYSMGTTVNAHAALRWLEVK